MPRNGGKLTGHRLRCWRFAHCYKLTLGGFSVCQRCGKVKGRLL